MNRVYQVYKGLQDAGRDILLPAPPLASYDGQEKGHVPNHGHGQIDRPDPHKGRKIFKTCLFKVEFFLKSSLDLIPSPSVKIQIMGGKVCLNCKGKTMFCLITSSKLSRQ